MTPAEQARADVEAWWDAWMSDRAMGERPIADLVARLVPVYEQAHVARFAEQECIRMREQAERAEAAACEAKDRARFWEQETKEREADVARLREALRMISDQLDDVTNGRAVLAQRWADDALAATERK